MTADNTPDDEHGQSLSELLSRLRTPDAGTTKALQQAAEATARTGSSLSEMLSALKPPSIPPIVIPDVQSHVAQIDFAQLPEARTARAAEDMAHRLSDYQAQVAALVAALQAQADDQRARADRTRSASRSGPTAS